MVMHVKLRFYILRGTYAIPVNGYRYKARDKLDDRVTIRRAD